MRIKETFLESKLLRGMPQTNGPPQKPAYPDSILESLTKPSNLHHDYSRQKAAKQAQFPGRTRLINRLAKRISGWPSANDVKQP